jgi:hypothetical protein
MTADRWTTYWACMSCQEGGVFEQAGSGGAAAKHTDLTQHGTITGLEPERVARVAERIRTGSWAWRQESAREATG